MDNKVIKVLNLYAGIGGNRKMWNKLERERESKLEITAVELDPKIAAIYKDNFPQDNVIIDDAHKYLLEHFREFDFIWSSPPCPTHSRVRKSLAIKKKKDGTIFEQNKPVFPDMTLYQEIIFLDNYYDGYYCVENVIPYYEPLIEPQKLGRHYFWTNLTLPNIKIAKRGNFDTIDGMTKRAGFDISKYSGIDKRRILRNCVEPEIGEIIFKEFLKNFKEKL